MKENEITACWKKQLKEAKNKEKNQKTIINKTWKGVKKLMKINHINRFILSNQQIIRVYKNILFVQPTLRINKTLEWSELSNFFSISETQVIRQ